MVDSQSECEKVETVSVQDSVCHGGKQASDGGMAEKQSRNHAAITEINITEAVNKEELFLYSACSDSKDIYDKMSKGKFKGLHKLFREKSKKGSQRISSYRKSREDRSPPGGGYETGRPNVDLVCKKDLISDSSSLPGIESVSDTS